MSTYVLVPGAGGEAWDWSRVVPLLRAAGHEALAVQLPAGREDATLEDYADVIAATAGRGPVRVVGHSMGAFSAPLVAHRVEVEQLMLVAPMIPAPGESVEAWWSIHADGLREAPPFDAFDSFFHDVPADVVAEARAREAEGRQGAAAATQRWPLPAWPDVPTRVLVAEHDRLFPLAFATTLARDRLGVEPDAIACGHMVALARPQELVDWLLRG
jgi:pimeloyl-ACP methyl ester carboxylesterase